MIICLQWFSYDCLMISLISFWFFLKKCAYGFLFLWFLYDFLMNILWYPYDFFMIFILFPYDLLMMSYESSYYNGLLMMFLWFPNGFLRFSNDLIVFLLISYDCILMVLWLSYDSRNIVSWLPYEFLMICVCFLIIRIVFMISWWFLDCLNEFITSFWWFYYEFLIVFWWYSYVALNV